MLLLYMYTVEPVLCSLCHGRSLVLNDRFHRRGLFLIDVCTTCYERPPSLERPFSLGRMGGLLTLSPLHYESKQPVLSSQ